MKVLIGGFFDILHSGHILAMAIAKSYGDYLIINVSPDNRARKKKGKGRPILSAKERMFCVESLRIVDEVVSIPYDESWDEDDYQIEYLKAIEPDIFIRTEYSERMSNFCREQDIKMKILREVPGFDELHSTDIIERISNLKYLNKK